MLVAMKYFHRVGKSLSKILDNISYQVLISTIYIWLWLFYKWWKFTAHNCLLNNLYFLPTEHSMKCQTQSCISYFACGAIPYNWFYSNFIGQEQKMILFPLEIISFNNSPSEKQLMNILMYRLLIEWKDTYIGIFFSNITICACLKPINIATTQPTTQNNLK